MRLWGNEQQSHSFLVYLKGSTFCRMGRSIKVATTREGMVWMGFPTKEKYWYSKWFLNHNLKSDDETYHHYIHRGLISTWVWLVVCIVIPTIIVSHSVLCSISSLFAHGLSSHIYIYIYPCVELAISVHAFPFDSELDFYLKKWFYLLENDLE